MKEQSLAHRVLCAGESLYDVISPHGASHAAFLYGGQPANVAVALQRLGTPSGFAGGIGRDACGDELFAAIAASGVDVRGVQRIEGWPTRTVLVEHAPGGERVFAGFGGAAPDAFADAYFCADDIPGDLLADVGLLVLGSLELAYLSARKALERLRLLAQTRGSEIVVDLNRREVFWPSAQRPFEVGRTRALAQTATVLKASDDEARWLFGTDLPAQISAALPRAHTVLVTRGPQGCAYDVMGRRGELAAYRVDAIDTTGAGDAFLAGFLHCLVRDGPQGLQSDDAARDAVRYASAVGALATTVRGAFAAMPTADEVAALMRAPTSRTSGRP